MLRAHFFRLGLQLIFSLFHSILFFDFLYSSLSRRTKEIPKNFLLHFSGSASQKKKMPVNRSSYYQLRRQSIQTSRAAAAPQAFVVDPMLLVSSGLAQLLPGLDLTGEYRASVEEYLASRSPETCKDLLSSVLVLLGQHMPPPPSSQGLNLTSSMFRGSSPSLLVDASIPSVSKRHSIIRKSPQVSSISPVLSRIPSNVASSPRAGIYSVPSPSQTGLERQSSSHLFAPPIHTRQTHLIEDEDDDSIIQINEYCIVDEAGRGSFGAVKIAVKENDEQVYAIKIIPRRQLRTNTLPPAEDLTEGYIAQGDIRRPSDESFAASIEREKPHSPSPAAVPSLRCPAEVPHPPPPKESAARESPGIDDALAVTCSPKTKDEPVLFTPSPPAGKPAGPQRLAIVVDVETTDSPSLSPRQFHEEVEVMKKLHHRNVVRLIEVIDDPSDPNLYLVMPYCDRGPILCMQKGEPTAALDIDVARGYMRQIVAGLAYLHGKGLAHLDIKPDNILLDAQMRCYLSDFGTSKFFKQPHESDAKHQVLLSGFRGTPSFAAPEVIAAAGYDPFPADMWSLGVTFYAMVFGHLPFKGQMLGALIDSILTTEPDYRMALSSLSTDSASPRSSESDDTDLTGDISLDLDEAIDLIKLLLNRNPAKRPTAVAVRTHPFLQQRRLRRGRASEMRDEVEKSRSSSDPKKDQKE
jgi:serine/threonine protein kinase